MFILGDIFDKRIIILAEFIATVLCSSIGSGVEEAFIFEFLSRNEDMVPLYDYNYGMKYTMYINETNIPTNSRSKNDQSRW